MSETDLVLFASQHSQVPYFRTNLRPGESLFSGDIPVTRLSRTIVFGLNSHTTDILLLCLVSSLFLLQHVWAAEQDKVRWNKKYATEKYLFGQEAILFLKDHVGLLPKGQVLDLAIGEGRNAIFLATQGFDVTGIDISEEGLKKAQALATKHGVRIITIVADLETYKIPANTFDVIICARITFSEICFPNYPQR
jgi:methyltransferase family protein